MAVKKNKRKKHTNKSDRLISELERIESALQEWIESSPENAQLFRQDPIRGMQAAGLDIVDATMLELEMITRDIARKLSSKDA